MFSLFPFRVPASASDPPRPPRARARPWRRPRRAPSGKHLASMARPWPRSALLALLLCALGASGGRPCTTSEKLWAAHLAVAEESASHGFVLGLADASGRVSAASFAAYIAQDATFLHAFAQAYALAMSKVPRGDVEALRDFHGLIGAVLEEMQLHAAYARDLGIDLDGADGRPSEATLAYTDFLLGVGRDADSPAEVLAAMVPCMRLYARIGALLRAAFPDSAGTDNPFAEWVMTYSSGAFEEAAAVVEALLDDYAARPGAPPAALLSERYGRAMRLEFNFFDAQAVGGDEGLDDARAAVSSLLEGDAWRGCGLAAGRSEL